MPGNRGVVGTVIQSYLHRSEQDVNDLLAQGIRIRLCKGAYKEPPEIAFQKKSEVDANYVKLMKILMKSGIYHGLATHDEAIIKEAKAFATREKIARDSFEFQMLHGIRRDLQQQLVREGWGMKAFRNRSQLTRSAAVLHVLVVARGFHLARRMRVPVLPQALEVSWSLALGKVRPLPRHAHLLAFGQFEVGQTGDIKHVFLSHFHRGQNP